LDAVEYCIHQNVKVGIHMGDINKSFQKYIQDCYGNEVFVSSLKEIRAKNLIHSFTYQRKIEIQYENYFYVSADYHSTQMLSETEQYLSIVKALYLSTYTSLKLSKLKESYSSAVENLVVDNKYVLYPGGSSVNSAKRWPHYVELMNKLGKENVIIVGGTDDLNYSYSYFYPKYLSALLPQAVMNKKSVWKFFKKLGLLKPHAQNDSVQTLPNAYINHFTWPELVSIFKRCKLFIGNDGGLMHLAGAAGANGYALFGPTSVNKNKPYNQAINPISKSYTCQPCQFAVGGISMTKSYINCPYQVRCLNTISTEAVIEKFMKK
jgi:ADP-heptose:LPS heptosyltransferase